MNYEEPTVDEMLDLFDDIVREHITTGGNYALPMRSDDEKEFLESIAPIRALITKQSQPITEDDVRWALDAAIGKMGEGKGAEYMIEFLRSKRVVVGGDGRGDLTKDIPAMVTREEK